MISKLPTSLKLAILTFLYIRDRVSSFNSDLALPSKDSLLLNTTAIDTNEMTIRCSGGQFGFYPDVADCESAKGYIPQDFGQREWGERGAGLGEVVPLPYRVMGGTPTWIMSWILV